MADLATLVNSLTREVAIVKESASSHLKDAQSQQEVILN